MPFYNFKQKTKLYLVYAGNQYSVDIYPDVSFSQTFNETPIEVKTLHNQYNMFDKATITRANPANFNFTIPLLRQSDLKVIFDLLIDYDTTNTEVTLKSFDLYFKLDTVTYAINNCVIESGVFQIVKDRFISLAVSGSGSKLYEFTGTIPGVVVARSSSSTYVAPNAMSIQVNSVTQAYVTAVSLEVSNSVQWLDYDTLHKSLSITGVSGTMYPETFVVSKRNVSGSVQKYITDDNNSTVNTWAVDVPLRIRVGASSSAYLLDFNFPTVVYTNRLDVQDIYIQSFDFRLTSSPTSLSSIMSLITI